MKTSAINTALQNVFVPSLLALFLLTAACSRDEEQTVATNDEAAVSTAIVADEQARISADMTAPPADIDEADCDTNGTQVEQLERARAMSARKYSPDSLACGAALYTNIATAKPGDVEIQVEAMTVLEEVLFYLRVIQSLDLMGVDKVNSDRILTFGKRYIALAGAAFNKAVEDPRLMIHKALSAKESEGAYDLSLLEQAIEKDAAALGGLAQLRLGRLLFELPSILGGDFQASIKLLEQAVEINPQNMQARYYLAEVYEQEMKEDKAAQTMAGMLEINSVKAELQMSTDMLRLAIGLTQRMGKKELSVNLRQKRESILTANPELMTRVSIAVGGHGGEHPLTGE